MKGKPESKNRKNKKQDDFWELRLYVAGQTPKSIEAFANLKKICEENLKGKCRIEVIDLLKNPQLAKGDQILAIPTLVRKLPQPIKKIIGDLSNTERVLVGLDIKTRDEQGKEWTWAPVLAPCGIQLRKGENVKPKKTTEVFDQLLQQKANGKYVLRLYIAGLTPRSQAAIKNIKKICDEHLQGRYDLEVIDVYQQPVLARGEQIIAAPTLIKKLPLPLRKFIGDLADTERILLGLDLRPKMKRVGF